MINKYLENLNWRYAVKKFDTNKKLSEDQGETLKESIRLSPSSFGLMPYKVFVVSAKEIKEKLKEAAFGQAQLSDSSHVFVFAVRNSVDEEYIEDFVSRTAQVRNVPADALAQYKNMMLGFASNLSPDAQRAWADKQAYIGLGFLLDSAAQNGIDACPMEGFDSAKIDGILGLKEFDLHTAVICPVGFRAEDDSYASAKKVRFSKEELFISK